MYGRALSSAARTRGLLLGLLAVGVFWVAAWQQSVLMREVTANIGDMQWQPAAWRQWMFVLIYATMAGWSAAAVYAFAGREGLKRIWLPGAVFMTLMILNFGRASRSWVTLWDIKAQWSYGYFIGPVAAMLLYFLLAEKGKRSAAATAAAGGSHSATDNMDDQAVMFGVAIDTDAAHLARASNGWLLLVWGAVAAGLGLAGMVAAKVFGKSLGGGSQVGEALQLSLNFAYLPFALGVVMLALGLWQRAAKQSRGDLAVRLAGLALIILGVVLRIDAGLGDVKVHYFSDVTIMPVLFGAVLALGGWAVMRVAWVSLAYLVLAIPWPERYYLALAASPQKWAAIMAEKFMTLCGYHMERQGTTMIIGGERLDVAAQCSGLKMLLAFVALSVVYAFI